MENGIKCKQGKAVGVSLVLEKNQKNRPDSQSLGQTDSACAFGDRKGREEGGQGLD